MSKKAFVDIQFNWIYIALVGAIILIVGFSIISTMKKNAQQELVFDIQVYLDNILKNIQLNKKAESNITLPEVEVMFECNSFSFTGPEISNTPLIDNIVFSPDIIKQKIHGYALSWYMPFEVEYFSYLTGSDIKYVVIGSEKIYDLLPNHINKELALEFIDDNNYKTRYISNITPNSISPGASLLNITILEDLSSFPDSFGIVTYYDDNLVNTSEVFFMDSATLLGAIYSEDGEKYNCLLKKSLEKLRILSLLKKDKINQFIQKYPYCPYEKTINLLEALIDLEITLDYSTLNYIYQLSKDLEKENQLLHRLSCPMIY